MAKTKTEKFVTEEKFNELSESVNSLVGLVKESLDSTKELKDKLETKVTDTKVIDTEKQVEKAGPKFYNQVNPEWVEKAEEIIGKEKIERCEVDHLRSGGLMFTVVVKKEYSNAPDDYIKMHKEDRRTKEIGNEGIGGVEAWCKLISRNLAKGKAYVSSN